MFPSPSDLQRRLADVEIELFLGRGAVDEELLATGWYLHAIGSARAALQLYTVDRQRRANQVAAHIFDLALATGQLNDVQQREVTLAGQVSYLRGELQPNAMALYRRVAHSDPRLLNAPGSVSLDVGSALLALDRSRLFRRLGILRNEAQQLRAVSEVTDLIDTPYASAARVVEGCFELLVHLTYDAPQRLERARQLFQDAIDPPRAQMDLDSRWVAAHLRDIADDLGSTSVWAHLPPSVPRSAARAMTLGDPPVLSLWPPQLDLVSTIPNPLSIDTKRILLSFPTSGGKTLISQFIIAAHIASGAGSACIVVPTNSLGRELQRDLDTRLGILARTAMDAGPLGVPLPSHASALIMTPEKFAAHLHGEPERLLQEFTLFLIDEAHFLGDHQRGWVLESALGFLHAATREAHHRIVLVSAALGNRAHVANWLGNENSPAFTFHRDWRGPRRAHAVFVTTPDWNQEKVVHPTGKVKLTRKIVPLHGQLEVRTAPGRHRSLRTPQPMSSLVLVQRPDGWKRDSGKNEPLYVLRARMATHFGSHGSVLIIEPTKIAAQRTASALANQIGMDDPSCTAIATLAATRLGETHPLVTTLRRGVGFHHSALPDDVQAELEDGLRKGPLKYLVATTTLVEGINFPVRSVLIGDRGYESAEGFITTLDAPKLLNAIGRAGRATRETEGWVVLTENKGFSSDDFDQLDGNDAELTAVSRLSTQEALEALGEFEDLLARSEDAIFETANNAAANFISHVWFVASGLKDLHQQTADAARLSIESTLAWQQLDETTRERWRRVADHALDWFERTPEQRRTRWARTGTSLRTAALLERLAVDVRAKLPEVSDRKSPVDAFTLIAQDGRLEVLLDASEVRVRRFRPYRNAPSTTTIDIDLRSLIRDWLTGGELGELGEAYLASVPDEIYRYEQLSEFVSQVLEHLLPWLLNTVVSWVNEGLADSEQLCTELPAYLRHGVDTPVALELARAGVRSRRLAHVVARFAASEAVDSTRAWLAQSDLRSWSDKFEASPTELADLLFFIRAADANITSRALDGEIVDIPFRTISPAEPGPVDIVELEEAAPPRLAVVREQHVLGHIGPEHQRDINRLLSTGVPLTVTLVDASQLQIRVDDPTERTAWFGSRESR